MKQFIGVIIFISLLTLGFSFLIYKVNDFKVIKIDKNVVEKQEIINNTINYESVNNQYVFDIPNNNGSLTVILPSSINKEYTEKDFYVKSTYNITYRTLSRNEKVDLDNGNTTFLNTKYGIHNTFLSIVQYKGKQVVMEKELISQFICYPKSYIINNI